MKARPSRRYYCGSCSEYNNGDPRESEAPVFFIGCCYDLEWEGTRDQAGELYDYLVREGYLRTRERGACGCTDYADNFTPYIGWKCGVCGEFFDEDDWEDPQKQAVDCCKDRAGANT